MCTLPRITISVKQGVKLARESLGLEIAKDEMSQNVSMNCGTVVFELLPDMVKRRRVEARGVVCAQYLFPRPPTVQRRLSTLLHHRTGPHGHALERLGAVA